MVGHDCSVHTEYQHMCKLCNCFPLQHFFLSIYIIKLKEASFLIKMFTKMNFISSMTKVACVDVYLSAIYE